MHFKARSHAILPAEILEVILNFIPKSKRRWRNIRRVPILAKLIEILVTQSTAELYTTMESYIIQGDYKSEVINAILGIPQGALAVLNSSAHGRSTG